MQLSNIFQSKQTQPTVLPKATFEELKSNHSRRPYTYMVDVYDPQEEYVKRRLSPEMAEIVLETCKRLKSVCDGPQRLYLTTVDSTRNSHYGSSSTISNPCFFLSTNPNSYYVDKLNFAQLNVKDAEIVQGATNGYGSSESKQWALNVEIAGEDFSMLCPLDAITRFPNFKMTADGNFVIGQFKSEMTPLALFIYMSSVSRYLDRSNDYSLNYSTASQLYGTNLLEKYELNKLMAQVMSTSSVDRKSVV